MTDKTVVAPALSKEEIFDQRTSLVKAIVDRHNAALDERTRKLRVLRLEKQTTTVQPPTQKPGTR